MTRVAILDDYQNVALEMADWGKLGDAVELTVFNEPLGDLDAVARRLEPFEVLCIMRERTPFPAALIERLPNLKLLVTSGARNAAIDLEAAAGRGVVVCGTSASGHPTAELTWGLILALMRKIPEEAARVRAGRWQETLGHDLHGKTLGILGLGRLGARVAQVGAAFGMRLIAWSQNLPAERAAECVAELVGKETLLAEADIVTIHLVLSPRTRDLLGPSELALMKPGAYLVNTSRGPIVNEAALLQALRDGAIRGAGLDVYDVEPLPPEHPLRRLENVVLTPHVGYVTEENYRAFYAQMIENTQAWRDGAPIRVIAPAG